MKIKMGYIDNNDNASFCLCRQVWAVTLVTMQPIPGDTKSSRRCRKFYLMMALIFLDFPTDKVSLSHVMQEICEYQTQLPVHGKGIEFSETELDLFWSVTTLTDFLFEI